MRMMTIVLAALLVLSIAACGNKGNLKTPEQIEIHEQKKLRKEEKKKQEASKKAASQPDGKTVDPALQEPQ